MIINIIVIIIQPLSSMSSWRNGCGDDVAYSFADDMI